MDITTLGIDIAKSVFQLHGIDADGAVVVQKKLRRGAVLNFLGNVGPCLIGMEACATSRHSDINASREATAKSSKSSLIIHSVQSSCTEQSPKLFGRS
jgi:transposase